MIVVVIVLVWPRDALIQWLRLHELHGKVIREQQREVISCDNTNRDDYILYVLPTIGHLSDNQEKCSRCCQWVRNNSGSDASMGWQEVLVATR